MGAVSLRIPDDVSQRLQELADLEDLRLAEQRLFDLRAGKSQTIPLGGMTARYGLENRD